MITVLMLDLGDTLVRNHQVLPHVPEALRAFQAFVTEDDEPLDVCLVSDFLDAQPPTGQRVDEIFHQYVGLLTGFGLVDFFEPVDQRVTLSTHAGVRKPDVQVFRLAIARLGVDAQLTESLFVTENASHIAACEQLGMQTLRFGSSLNTDGVEFTDWRDAPRLIANHLGGSSLVNANAVVAARIAAEHGISDVSIVERRSPTHLIASGNVLQTLRDPTLGDCDGVCVYMPVQIEIQLDEQGNVDTVNIPEVSAMDTKDAATHLKSLIDSKSIAEDRHSMGKTHVIESQGQKRVLKRIGFN